MQSFGGVHVHSPLHNLRPRRKRFLQLEEFRKYHDALYAGFSKIEMTVVGRRQMGGDLYKFDMIHIISPQSTGELEKMCSMWLPMLNFSGVALISGRGQLDESGFKTRLSHACPRCSVRILQMDHWVAILSIQPIGIVRDLLLSPDDGFLPLASLLRLLGDRVRSQLLSRRLAAAEESEIYAQIRLGQTALRLDKTWLEKEDLRTLQHLSDAGTKTSTEDAKSTLSLGDDGLFAGTRTILLRLRQQYSGERDAQLGQEKSSGTNAAVPCLRRFLRNRKGSLIRRQPSRRFPSLWYSGTKSISPFYACVRSNSLRAWITNSS